MYCPFVKIYLIFLSEHKWEASQIQCKKKAAQ